MIRFDYGICGTRRVLTMGNNEDLVVRPLQENEAYTAISHTWGESRTRIEGIGWDIASWLSHRTCKALVEAYSNVWIDSLCIKQVDEEDRNAQIKEMQNVYRSAQGVVVVLVGDYGAQVSALLRILQLLQDLESVKECTLSSSDCSYVRILEELRDAVAVVREMAWFRRVWTLQEAVLSAQLTFVGFDDEGGLQTDVTTVEELTECTRVYDEISDVSRAFFDINDYEENVWLRHSCTRDTFPVVADVGNIMQCIKPVNLRWYGDLTGKDKMITLGYTTDTVFRQLGSNHRECERLHDLVYGVCALLEIDLLVDYDQEFEDVFLDSLKQLVKRGVCVLPQRPQPVHGRTWLPSLEHIDLKNAWKTVKDWDFYHSVVAKGDKIFAKGSLVQVRQPHVFRSSMESVVNALVAVVSSVLNPKTFRIDGIDPITCVVLWMFKNHARNDVPAVEVESLIYSVCGRMIIFENLGLFAADFARDDVYDVAQIVRYILMCCDLVWRAESVYRDVPYSHNCDVVLVCKRKLGLVLYSAPSSVKTSSAYGVFYKHAKGSKVHGMTGNVLAQNNDGIWDNHGRALFWYISRWDIPESKVCLGKC